MPVRYSGSCTIASSGRSEATVLLTALAGAARISHAATSTAGVMPDELPAGHQLGRLDVEQLRASG